MPAPQTPGEMEAIMVENLSQTTGHKLSEWMEIIKSVDGLQKRELVQWLRTEHGLKMGTASILMQIYFNDGKLVYGDIESLVEGQYGKNGLKPVYEAFNEFIVQIDPAIKIGVCKGYTSYLKDVQFAVTVPKAKEIRLGLALGDRMLEGRLEKAKSLGTNDKIGHQVVIKATSDLDDELLSWIKEAYTFNLKVK